MVNEELIKVLCEVRPDAREKNETAVYWTYLAGLRKAFLAMCELLGEEEKSNASAIIRDAFDNSINNVSEDICDTMMCLAGVKGGESK